jgi:hypothetical protein
MNMHYSSQDVVLTATWEYVEAPYYEDYKLGTPYWLDIAGCDHSDRPAANNSHFTYSSPSYRADFRGDIAYLGSHMHDGAVLQEITKNRAIVCSANPQYTPGGSVNGRPHILHIPFCLDAGSIAFGDELSVTASYDTIKHAPMVNEDGSLEPIMGIALAYILQESTPMRGLGNQTGFGWIMRTAIASAVVLLVAGSAYAFYVAKHQKRWLEWFPRQRKYQSLRSEEGE